MPRNNGIFFEILKSNKFVQGNRWCDIGISICFQRQICRQTRWNIAFPCSLIKTAECLHTNVFYSNGKMLSILIFCEIQYFIKEKLVPSLMLLLPDNFLIINLEHVLQSFAARSKKFIKQLVHSWIEKHNPDLFATQEKNIKAIEDGGTNENQSRTT